MKFELEFYTTANNKNPVDEFIQALHPKDISKILRDLDLLREFGDDLHYPYVDSIKGDKYKGLLELRTKFASNIFRIFYFVVVCADGETPTAVLLHGMQKKDQQNSTERLGCRLGKNEGLYITEEKMNFDDYKAGLFGANPEIKKEYDALEPEYELIRQIIGARIERNMTQKQLAEKIGTKQSSIARLESGTYNPSLQFLQKVANALGKQLSFSLR